MQNDNNFHDMHSRFWKPTKLITFFALWYKCLSVRIQQNTTTSQEQIYQSNSAIIYVQYNTHKYIP